MTTFGPKDADAWYARNKHKLDQVGDPVMRAIEQQGIWPNHVLEVGCADGWRLRKLHDKYECQFDGVELSMNPVHSLNSNFWKRGLIWEGNAKTLGAWSREHDRTDLLIYGFCLYVCEPTDLLQIAATGDLALKDNGYIIIHDFLPDHPYSRIFEHNKELRSRKCDHAQLWLAHPAYSMVRRDIYGDDDDRTHVTILKKDMANAFPLQEI